jgi:hypothetical protein
MLNLFLSFQSSCALAGSRRLGLEVRSPLNNADFLS